ncbi:unnamed protein product [Peniophora sp. CBMAI 1063]|nr:unnamed protein product [Peniophora sp. CBMAI 1063]
MPAITHILFDCDNTLVLSEHIAFAACAELSNELLEKYGKEHRYTPEAALHEFVGKNFRTMLGEVQQKHGFTMPPEEIDAYVARELGVVIAGLRANAKPCEGVPETLARLKNENKYKLAVVSSSALPRVEASIEAVQIDHYFPSGTVFSAMNSLPVPTSKPDPAVYLFACEKLGATPAACVAIEDSRSGATAARRAGITLIGYVGCYDDAEERTRMRDILNEVGAVAILEHFDQLEEVMKKIEAA